MFVIAAAERLFTAFNTRCDKPFTRVPARGTQRTILLASYNDLAAPMAGHTQTARVMVDIRKDGSAAVCFGPDYQSPTHSKSCPPGFVIEGLATGVYEQFLKPHGVAPEKVSFHDYIPAYTFKGPTFFDSVNQPALWRTAKMHWSGTQYNLAAQPETAALFDPRLSRKVPKALLQLQVLEAQVRLDLSRYTPPTSRQQAQAALS